MPSIEGFGKGRTDPTYPGTDIGTPLLSKFYFRYEVGGAGGAVDNHLNTMMVMPAGRAEDLSPQADIPGPVITPGRIGLVYQDDDPSDAKDRYFYRVEHLSRAVLRPRRFQLRDVGCLGSCERVLPRPPGSPIGAGQQSIFVLIGFQVFFTGNRDHHIDELAVFERDGRLTVKLNDRKNDPDDVFGYVVDYALINGTGFNVQLGEERGRQAAGGQRVSLPGQERKVLRGFEFNFNSDDNHIRDAGVLAFPDRLEVFFGDKDPTDSQDRFDWMVRWASISPMVFEQGT